MQIALSDAEREVVARYLERAMRGVREEIGKTENYDFRQGLKADEDQLKAVLARLALAA